MLALIAGRGTLPAQVAQAQASAPLIVTLEGYALDGLDPDIVFRLEHLGSLLVELGHRGVTDVCLCGSVDRPQVDPSAIDAATLPLVPLIQAGLAKGDDGALRTLMDLFEQTGFTVRAAQDLLPDLIATAGVLSRAAPTARIREDARRGLQVLAALAPLDVGQSCVVSGGQILAIEALGGTDFMLSTLPDTPLRDGAVLVKGPKTGQDRRADMPTIGPDTVATAAAAGLAGIVIDAGGVILLDPDEAIEQANAAGLLLWSRTAE